MVKKEANDGETFRFANLALQLAKSRDVCSPEYHQGVTSRKCTFSQFRPSCTLPWLVWSRVCIVVPDRPELQHRPNPKQPQRPGPAATSAMRAAYWDPNGMRMFRALCLPPGKSLSHILILGLRHCRR